MNLFERKNHNKAKLVNDQLDQIESEMKLIGYWSPNPPVFKATHNYMEAPSFELWLQCFFIPNARKAAKKNKYPSKSQIGLLAMRQYDYHSYIPEAQNLLKLLQEFDKIIEM